jgi:hypothetical protein
MGALGEFEQLVLLSVLRASRTTLIRLWSGLEGVLGEAER